MSDSRHPRRAGRVWGIALVPVLAAAALTAACSAPDAAQAAPSPRVLFADEFDGPAGPVGTPWRAETGGGGWGNNEMQVYTDDTENVRIDGDGNLAITARYDDGVLTSARVTTLGGYSITYGEVAARITLPAGQGLHPAFWLLGDDIESVGWPTAGEIDIIETLNHADYFHTGIHAPQSGTPRGQNLAAAGPVPFPLAATPRTYWMRKSPGRIETGVDDTSLFVVTADELNPDARWVFDAPFHLILNLAVGGDWPGAPDLSTPNPSTMLVDWVRVTEL